MILVERARVVDIKLPSLEGNDKEGSMVLIFAYMGAHDQELVMVVIHNWKQVSRQAGGESWHGYLPIRGG
jgi:hypothetical protein